MEYKIASSVVELNKDKVVVDGKEFGPFGDSDMERVKDIFSFIYDKDSRFKKDVMQHLMNRMADGEHI